VRHGHPKPKNPYEILRLRAQVFRRHDRHRSQHRGCCSFVGLSWEACRPELWDDSGPFS
jgi:hypothetical protein